MKIWVLLEVFRELTDKPSRLDWSALIYDTDPLREYYYNKMFKSSHESEPRGSLMLSPSETNESTNQNSGIYRSIEEHY